MKMLKVRKSKQIRDPSNYAKRKNPWGKRLLIIFICLLVVVSIALGINFGIKKYYSSRITLKSIKSAWKEYDYSKVYEYSKAYLQEKPYNNTAMTYYSYACFYLSQSQTDTQIAQTFLDESINNLRVALYSANDSLKPQLYYMLGRAYFYKNKITSHYYADLAIKYLLLARDNGFEADDISLYLGLSYASLGMPKESISAFTGALLVRESDSLLLSIAEQYYASHEYSAAKQYLHRIISSSSNDEMIITSKNLLGQIYLEEENYEDALKEFNDVLEKNPGSGDAHYGLGLIYEKQGNLVAARAEWRNTRKVQPNHAGALQKLEQN